MDRQESGDEGGDTAADRAAGRGVEGIRLRCMGTRGSIASPGPDTLRYGGNTPCVEVLAGDERLIFDAGTGIRVLGEELKTQGEPVDATIFLTHFHWDHVQGFPFFAPAWDEASRIRVVGPAQTGPGGEELSVERMVGGLMGSSYFPVPMSALAGVRSFGHLNEGVWRRGGVTVRALRVKHASFAVGYRVSVGRHAMAYVPDNELLSDVWPATHDWRARFVGLLAGVDVLIHDAMYTEAEYRTRAGNGHSTFAQVMDLAEEAEVGELLFFHHEPRRSDDELDDLVDRARNDALAEGRTFGIRAAREGEVVVTDGSGTGAADAD